MRNMYLELEQEFYPQFQKLDVDFNAEYVDALNKVNELQWGSLDDKHEAIRNILSEVLKAYSESKATTKAGRWGRFIAGIGSKIVKFFKFNRNANRN